MNKVPKNADVCDITEILNTGKKFERQLITNCGYCKLPLHSPDNIVILNVIFYRDETTGLAILASDENGNMRDYIWNALSGCFDTLTNRGECINWKNKGFSDSPRIAQNYWVNDFNEKGYIQEPAVISFADDAPEEEISKMIREIENKEPAVANALKMVVRHIHGTYSDKYAKGQDIIDTKKMLYDKEHGDFLNAYQVNRYLQRYLTKGSAKSHLIKDIEKAIHYLVFELTRRILMGDVNEIEPKH